MNDLSQHQNCTTLPAFARSPLNRCNLPAVILGSLAFQREPVALHIDGVKDFHKQLFSSLEEIESAEVRALHFHDYMSSCFLLDNKEEAGFDPNHPRFRRGKLNYLRLLRGWMFNADGMEAAVLKRWVESRFGLLPRNHMGPLGDHNSDTYEAYIAEYMRGIYNTNAIESQIDLLYTYCQYERHKQNKTDNLQLFRGVNKIDSHDVIKKVSSSEYIMLLNNLNSFSNCRDQSDTFGDYILSAQIPSSKLLYFPNLLPGVLQGEQEYLVIGGVYRTSVSW